MQHEKSKKGFTIDKIYDIINWYDYTFRNYFY